MILRPYGICLPSSVSLIHPCHISFLLHYSLNMPETLASMFFCFVLGIKSGSDEFYPQAFFKLWGGVSLSCPDWPSCLLNNWSYRYVPLHLHVTFCITSSPLFNLSIILIIQWGSFILTSLCHPTNKPNKHPLHYCFFISYHYTYIIMTTVIY